MNAAAVLRAHGFVSQWGSSGRLAIACAALAVCSPTPRRQLQCPPKPHLTLDSTLRCSALPRPALPAPSWRQVRSIAEMGAYVSLLEYGGIEGMILLSELSRRRIRSVQKLIKVGRQEPVMVLRVDKEKGYIDLSKRRVSPEDLAVSGWVGGGPAGWGVVRWGGVGGWVEWVACSAVS